MKTLPVTAYYSGENGTYSSIIPGIEATGWLQRVCSRAEWYGFTVNNPLDRHITVVHSENAIPYPLQAELWNNPWGIGSDATFTVVAREFLQWPGHDNSGYLVLAVDCPQLSEFNAWLVDRYGLTGSFPEYNPHVTIATDAYSTGESRAVMLCDQLQHEFLSAGNTVELQFTGLRLEDLK